ncbi:hypothetical protein HYV81_03790 [Candidatus Woesearchaeota archaeon]|nr:hypothetical protein [Candidatus Woesearchaeota archaeon]
MVGKIAYDIFAVSFRTSNSFTTMIGKMESVKEGSQDPLAFFLDKDKNAILAFSPDAQRLELINKEYNGAELMLTYVERLSTCQKGKSCICLCSELSVGESIGSESRCTAAAECRALNTVAITSYTLISERRSDQVGSSKNLMQSYFWKNGFAIVRSETLPAYFNNIPGIKINQNVKAVYVRKDLGKVGVCTTSNCEILPPGTYN